MSFDATAAAISARNNRLSTFRKHLKHSVFATLMIAATCSGSMAQEVGKYYNADGSRTNDLEAAARTWREDKEFQGDWGLKAIKAEYAYARGFTGKNIKLGVIDSGTYAKHPEFSKPGKLVPIITKGTRTIDDEVYHPGNPEKKAGKAFELDGGMPFYGLDRGKYAFHDHGTHTGGTIAAQRDGKEMHGVAFDSTLYAANGEGLGPSNGSMDTFDPAVLATQFDQMVAAGVRVINNSWGMAPEVGNIPYTLADVMHQYTTDKTHRNLDAAERTTRAGVILVFSAGNESGSQPDAWNGLPYFRPDPVIERHYVIVANTQDDNVTAPSSSLCGYTKFWCVSAPGTDIYSAIVSGSDVNNLQSGYKDNTGTSMAAPHVTGALGVLMERFPYLANSEVNDILKTTSTDLGVAGVDDISAKTSHQRRRYDRPFRRSFVCRPKSGHCQISGT